MPVNGLIMRALIHHYIYCGNGFIVECPTGSRQKMTLYQVAEELTRRLTSIFCERKTATGRCTEELRSFKKIHTGAITSRFTNVSTAIMVPDWEQVIKPAGPVSLLARCTCLQPPHRAGS
jgi:hypothetical protein